MEKLLLEKRQSDQDKLLWNGKHEDITRISHENHVNVGEGQSELDGALLVLEGKPEVLGVLGNERLTGVQATGRLNYE